MMGEREAAYDTWIDTDKEMFRVRAIDRGMDDHVGQRYRRGLLDRRRMFRHDASRPAETREMPALQGAVVAL